MNFAGERRLRTATMFLNKSQLFGRGWTEKMVNRFLGEPDRTEENPWYAKGPPMRLYRLERVEEAESSDAFKQSMADVARRRSAMFNVARDQVEAARQFA